MKAKSIILGLFLLIIANAHAQNFTSAIHDTAGIVSARFDPALATQQYVDQLGGQQKERSDAYFEGNYWLMLANMVYEMIVAWIFLSLGLSLWMKKIALKARRKNIQNLIYIAFYFLFSYLLLFPLTLYQGFIREHAYNLSNLSFGGWFGEEMISFSLQVVLGSLVIMLLYIAIRKTRENWWKWGAGIGILFIILMVFISPVFIDPLFNHYKPLDEGPVKEQILSLARANGVPADNVYWFNASKQSTRISANVSGIGSTIRISLNDNLLNRSTTPEIRSVMAHEIGHYVLNHTFKLILFMGLLLFAGFALVNRVLKKVLGRWGARWKITGIEDIGGLPLIMVLFSLFMFLATPIQNNISRRSELEADYFGLNAAREPDAFASTIMKLSEYRKISPGRWEEILFYDHPSGKTRIFNAMRWKAENMPGSRDINK
jgi:Zn-dependent protease with chaperone function